MLDLSALFDTLAPPSDTIEEGVRFSAHTVPGYDRYRLAKGEYGNPSLLLATAEPDTHLRNAPIVLEHLNVQFDVKCRISRPDGETEQGHFTVIRCSRVDSALRSYFLSVASTLIMALGTAPTQTEIGRTIDRFVELFRRMKEPPRKSVQGLWAELFLIARLRNPSLLVRAWHPNPEDRYDFSMDDQRIEVKSASNKVRQHHFSLDQLSPGPEMKVLVASLFVERFGAGTSIIDLVDIIRLKITEDPDLLLYIDDLVNATLGENWRQAVEDTFDRKLAEESIAFYEMGTIPKLSADLPIGVSHVHFRSDLRLADAVDVKDYRAMGGLFRAAFGR